MTGRILVIFELAPRLFYFSGWESPHIHFCVEHVWTNLPGWIMKKCEKPAVQGPLFQVTACYLFSTPDSARQSQKFSPFEATLFVLTLSAFLWLGASYFSNFPKKNSNIPSLEASNSLGPTTTDAGGGWTCP